jgi:hypothetical protein
MFYKQMMDTPIFNVRTCGGMSAKSNEFKDSVGLCSKCNTSARHHTEKFLQINTFYRDQKYVMSVVYRGVDSCYWKLFSIK